TRPGRRGSGRRSGARSACALSNARLAVFAAAIGALVWRDLGGGDAALWSAAVSVAGFLALVFVHAWERERERTLNALAGLNEEWSARAERRWELLPEHPPVDVPEDHPYATDLDLFGRASLDALRGPPAPPPRRRTPERRLLEPPRPAATVAPQGAARGRAAPRGL